MRLIQEFRDRVPALLHRLKSEPESTFIRRGEVEALALFQEMAIRVPAYKDFLKKNSIHPETIRDVTDLAHLPITNKENYLQSYPIEALCLDCSFANRQWMISSTSGSTGEPFYFPRSPDQDLQFRMTGELCLRDFYGIDTTSTLLIDCYALGVWIGGMFMFTAMKQILDSGQYAFSMITPGADKTETLKAIKRLAPQFGQVILAGYGPLVKDLIDGGIVLGIDWSAYNMKYFFAAEGFTEKFRDYIGAKGGVKNILTSTINHYGTADMGTMAHETPLSILLRRIALEYPPLYTDLFIDAHRQPTVAQYIPELYYFEAIEGRLLCSGRSGLPLMRYDLKDKGGVLSLASVVEKAQLHGVDMYGEARSHGIDTHTWNLPFVYLYERTDFTVGIYSVNVYPESIKKALQEKELEDALSGKFTMRVDFDEVQNQFLEINVELKTGVGDTDELRDRIKKSVIAWLLKENSEWRDFYADDGIRHKIIPRIVPWPYQDPKYFRAGRKQQWVERQK